MNRTTTIPSAGRHLKWIALAVCAAVACSSKPAATPGGSAGGSSGSGSGGSSPAVPANLKGTAVIKGLVKLEGSIQTKFAPVKTDPVCEQAHPGGTLPAQGTIVYSKHENRVPYAFVYIKKGIDGVYDTPAEPVVLDQKGCRYDPHVFGMLAGQGIDVKNSDPTNHNVHALPKKNEPFNFAQPNVGVRKRRDDETFGRTEFGPNAVKIKCDVHPWMGAWCHVMPHPFFDVTKDHYEFPEKDAQENPIPGNRDKWGTFEIGELPPGDYEIEAWHETFGTVTLNVTVGEGEAKEVTITFKRSS